MASRNAGREAYMQQETRLILNAKRMDTREHAHAHLKERLRLPAWYGANLDALNDCLGEINEPTRIILRFAPALERSLGEYGFSIIRVLQQAAETNKNITISLKTWF